MFTPSRQLAMIGNDYFVVGTVDRADWKASPLNTLMTYGRLSMTSRKYWTLSCG